MAKPTLDANNLASYHPTSNLSFISKLIKCIVTRRLSSCVSSRSINQFFSSGLNYIHLKVHCTKNWTTNGKKLPLTGSVPIPYRSFPIFLSFTTANGLVLHARWFRLPARINSWTASGICRLHEGCRRCRWFTTTYVTHQYADDMQLYMTSMPIDISSVRSTLAGCVNLFNTRCSSRRLLLNADKTELIWFGSRVNLSKICKSLSLSNDTETLTPLDTVWDLRVLLGSQLSMKPHIAKIATTCFFHLRRLRQTQLRRDWCWSSKLHVLTTATQTPQVHHGLPRRHYKQFKPQLVA